MSKQYHYVWWMWGLHMMKDRQLLVMYVETVSLYMTNWDTFVWQSKRLLLVMHAKAVSLYTTKRVYLYDKARDCFLLCNQNSIIMPEKIGWICMTKQDTISCYVCQRRNKIMIPEKIHQYIQQNHNKACDISDNTISYYLHFLQWLRINICSLVHVHMHCAWNQALTIHIPFWKSVLTTNKCISAVVKCGDGLICKKK